MVTPTPPVDDQLDLSGVTELTSGSGLQQVVVQPALRDRVVAWWLPRRVAAMVLLTPAILFTLLDSQAAGQPTVLLVAVSLGAALSLTSFVPTPGQSLRDVLRSPCATVGGIVPLACAASVLARPTSGSAFVALFFLGFALVQRFSGSSACGT